MKNLFWFLFLCFIILSVYFSGLTIQYYSDDLQFVFNPLPSNILYYFFQKNPANTLAYRPIQASLMILVQRFFSMYTLPIHLLSITVHIIMTWLIYIIMIKLQFSRLSAILGSVFMAVSQANVLAVLSNDTLSQILGTFFGCLCVWLMYRAYVSHTGPREYINLKFFFASMALFGFSVFSKETSISFLLSILLIIILGNYLSIRGNILIKRTIITIIPFCVLYIFYFVVRSLVVDVNPSFGPERYQFNIGINIINNLVQYFFSAFNTASTVVGYTAIKSGDIITFLIIAITTISFVTIVAYGLLISNRHTIIIILISLAIIGSFPVVLLNHIGELYVYNSMPFSFDFSQFWPFYYSYLNVISLG